MNQARWGGDGEENEGEIRGRGARVWPRPAWVRSWAVQRRGIRRISWKRDRGGLVEDGEGEGGGCL